MSSKKVKWISIRPSERQAQQSMLRSISNIYEACVELITNTEDEYERMNRNSSKYSGECRIELKRGNVVNNTVLKIKDKGRGMSAETLKSVLMDHGDRIKSDGAKRGFNGRGLIDVSAIGDVTIKSINSGKYSEARIKHLSFQMAMILNQMRI